MFQISRNGIHLEIGYLFPSSRANQRVATINRQPLELIFYYVYMRDYIWWSWNAKDVEMDLYHWERIRRIGRWWYICGHQLNSFHTYAACFWSVDVRERNLAITNPDENKERTKQIRWNRLIKSRVDHPLIGLMQSKMARCCRGQSTATESRRRIEKIL